MVFRAEAHPAYAHFQYFECEEQELCLCFIEMGKSTVYWFDGAGVRNT
jgi:hypothetical protein